jgi:hypothetical protein
MQRKTILESWKKYEPHEAKQEQRNFWRNPVDD